MEEIKRNFSELFSFFSSDYKLKGNEFQNQIQFRRLQNAIQQISEYRISIMELLDEHFANDKSRTDDFDTLLKLLFEYVAVTDTILRYSTDFISVDIEYAKTFIAKLFDNVIKLAKQSVKDEYDKSTINNMNRIKDDVLSLLNYWGK